MMDKRELAGRVALVTGSARNIGRAIALELANAGAAVMVNARAAAADAEAVANEIRGIGGEADVKLANVGDPPSSADLIEATVARFGGLDILVNNASVRRETDFERLDYAEWREILATTLDGAYLCSRAALPHLAAGGRGAIVNIGGVSSHLGARRRAHVIAAKAGLEGLTRALAHDLAAQNVTVNCVVPGLIATVRRRLVDGQSDASSESSAEAGHDRETAAEPAHHAALHPLVGRRGKPEEIAALVRFLCGPDARYITGQTIHASGGVFMG